MPDLDTPAKLAALEVDVSGVKGDVSGLRTDLNTLAAETRGGLARIYDRLEAQNSKGTNWGIIFAFAGVLFTVIIALSSWANTYFGQSIATVQRDAVRAMDEIERAKTELVAVDRQSAIERARIDERTNYLTREIDRLRESGQSRRRHAKNRLD